MTDHFVDLNDARQSLAELAAEAAQGGTVIITRDGKPLARLGPPEPAHRANEPRRGVTLPPEFEPADIRLGRMAREGTVPHRLRELPKH